MHHKEDHKKVEDDVQTMKKEKIDPKTVQISPTVSNCYPIHNYLKSMFQKRTPESAVIAKRISDHKKRVELEQKVEELVN